MKEKEIIDYEQEYYNLLYENRKCKRKIKELEEESEQKQNKKENLFLNKEKFQKLEEEIYILKKYKDVNIKKVLLEQISKYKRE